MNSSTTHLYSSQNAEGSQSRYSQQPFNSYTSQNTLYDPNWNASSKLSTVSIDNNEKSATSAPRLGPQNPSSPVGKDGLYATGGYAQGPPRSPSPTPSELEAAKRGVIDWKKLFSWRTWAKKKYIPWYLAAIVCLVLVALMTLYHKEIVNWLKPAAQWMQQFKFGWIIPIVVLFVISFPPLFGHEIVAVLCGLVWGLGVGFAIVAVGTLLGEIGNYYAFKYCCSARGEKLEKQKMSYACLARVVREGGFKIALIARLSAIPGHFTTAVFSTCGMGIFVFTLAAILSLPKQFITVYLGVILEQSNDTPEEQAKNKTSRIISDVVLAVTFVITVAAGWWIWREMQRVQPAVFRERRLAKKKVLASSMETQYLAGSSNVDVHSMSDDMNPVRPNDNKLGGYGYTGMGHPVPSTDAIVEPVPTRDVEAWPMSEMKSHGYPPAPYSDPYTQSQNSGRQPVNYDVSSNYHRKSRAPEKAPQLGDVSNLTGPRRKGREGFETSESTVGMGSWGGILRDGSETQIGQNQDDQATPRATTFSQQQSPLPATQSSYLRDGADEHGRIGSQGGLAALGAPLGGGETISVTPRNLPGARQSVEYSGHVGGRSMRAVVEGSDSDLAYMQASPPSGHHLQQATTSSYSSPQSQTQYSRPSHANSPALDGTGGRTLVRTRDMSAGTFGDQPSVHSREYASSGFTEERDEPFIPPGRR
ncbi:Tlg2-vesicle protein [Serendipita sp. 399]|nr:Tlg2-vesicle protein [Serendipita sp. 399]